MSVFEFDHYGEFLRAQVKANRPVRGYQSQLAAAAGCQRSLLSQVLAGREGYSLTRDHAAELAVFWGMTEAETQYFIGLVDLSKAGSKNLQALLKKQLTGWKRLHFDLSKQFLKPQIVGSEATTTYYSSWYWAAIHILASCPEYRTAETISKRLGISLARTKKIISYLKEIQVLSEEAGKYRLLSHQVHLPVESPMTEVNHVNWRNRAIHDVQKGPSESIHYSSVFAMSRKDYEKLRQMVLTFLISAREVITSSPQEEAYCLNLDCFEV